MTGVLIHYFFYVYYLDCSSRIKTTVTLFVFCFLGGGGGARGIHQPLSRFSSISQKREKIFSLNLVNFFTDKWTTICIIKLEDGPFLVAMETARIKGVQK